MGRELLTLQDISKYYTSGQSVVMGLSRINLTFRTGEFVAITGESGSGKSTLAKIIAGILPYESGELFISGSPTSHYDSSDWERYRRDSISFISQSYDILPGCSVERNVISALRLTGMDKADAAVRAKEILHEVELWELRSRRAAKLSSGQKQRLSIARALAKPAPILIADEPTGNLDGENSAKVVQLLAAAAKDRLVLIITHEFAEVEGHATRHITLQDSVVSSDVALRPAAAAKNAAPAPVRKRTAPRGLSLYTSFLQVSSRPVWSCIMLTFFALTAFAVFAFLGTFIVNLDDTNTRIYDKAAFRNGDKERIVVVRADGGNLTAQDIDRLLTVSHTERIEPYGLVSDINYFYRENVDYFLHYNAVGGGMLTDATGIDAAPTLENFSLFVQTIPALPDGREFLTAGRLPENMYEVVAGNEDLLGETITVYVQDTKNWAKTSYIALNATVVGTTDCGSHLYFHEQLGRSITTQLLHGSVFVLPNTDDPDSSDLC
ncbi:MAG: ATP-binding cassette domain-containing protein, partial [Oscillospiraceae bacterium]|nr:ATP-binding cassette domain-containing protein [Oscillospiraceae bacterium]